MAEEVRLCAVDDIEPGTSKQFVVGPHKIAVVRIGDDFYAIGDTCSHAEVSLSEGEVDEEMLELECWKHGSTFSLKSGEPQTLPATKPVPVYELRIEGGDVTVVLPA